MDRKSLSDILRGGNGGDDWLDGPWNTPAPEYGSPIPRGWYVAHVIDAGLFEVGTKKTPTYKLTFEIIEGEHKGRKQWYDIWLTPKARDNAQRDLPKLGITNKAQLESPIPSRRIRCRLTVVVRKDDDGVKRNEVRSFEVLGVDPPPALDAFAPLPVDPGSAPAGNGELFPGNGNTASSPYSEGR